jgi:hypothetical protein
MDEFNSDSIYSSGWRRLHREENENGMNKTYELSEKNYGDTIGINRQIYSKKVAGNRQMQGITAEKTLLYEEKQKEIMNKMNQLENEIISMKELLSNIQLNTETNKEIPNKNVIGSKLSRFFK